MMRRRWLPRAIVCGLVLAGCGSSHKSTTSSSASIPPPPPQPGAPPAAITQPGAAPAAIPPSAPPAIKAMTGRVFIVGDLPGFAPQGPRTIGMNAGAWIAEEGREGLPPSEQAKERTRLERLGFITGVHERLAPANGGPAEAISIVVRFRSPQGAQTDLGHEAEAGAAHGAKPFAVGGIPGARGFGGSTGGSTDYNVAFAAGPYYYLVGTGYPTGTAGAPSQAQVVLAAQRLYARVHH